MAYRTFGEITRDLLIARGVTTGIGNPNWSGFALELDGIHYETLRKAVTGERAPARKIMEAVAAQLDVEPSIFPEWRLCMAARDFDPREVGEEQALANLEAWEALSSARRRTPESAAA
jgi:hypothetical protein